MSDQLEERQIVVRVAVEPALRKIGSRRPQPVPEARNLTLPKARSSVHLARVAALFHLRFGGQEMPDAELLHDRLGDETVRRGDYHNRIAAAPVPLDTLASPGKHNRSDLLLEKPVPPAFQGRAIMLRQGPQLKAQELVNVEDTGLVFFVEAVVLVLVLVAIQDGLFDQENAPEIIAVTAQQGVVQIEDCEAQDRLRDAKTDRTRIEAGAQK